jgi:hypothetical protein
VHVQLVTGGTISTLVPGFSLRRTLARGIYLGTMRWRVLLSSVFVQYFHSPSWVKRVEEHLRLEGKVSVYFNSIMRMKSG